MPYIDYNTRKKINIWPGISGPVFHSDRQHSAILHWSRELTLQSTSIRMSNGRI
ncbi:MAG: hypothetical protein ABIO98_14440 [Chitinophagales bacterium]